MMRPRTTLLILIVACLFTACAADVIGFFAGAEHRFEFNSFTGVERHQRPARKLLAISRGEVLALTITGSVVGCCVLTLLFLLFVDRRSDAARQILPETVVRNCRHRSNDSSQRELDCQWVHSWKVQHDLVKMGSVE